MVSPFNTWRQSSEDPAIFIDTNTAKYEMQKRLMELYESFLLYPDRPLGEAAPLEIALAESRTHFLRTPYSKKVTRRERDLQILRMGVVVGRLFRCPDVQNAKRYLQDEWYW